MAQLTFPIGPAGPCVGVRVNLDGITLQAMRAAGKPWPSAASARGLIDTGTDISAVASSLLRQLAIPIQGHGTTQGVGGPIPVRIFSVTLSILDQSKPHLPWLVRTNLPVMELPYPLPVDALIGLDILLDGKLTLDGPARFFTLEF